MLRVEIEFSPLVAQKQRCKIKRILKTPLPMLQAPMRQLLSFGKLKIFLLTQRSIKILAQKFQKEFSYTALQEQARLSLPARLPAKRMFRSIQFQVLSLWKCLLVLAHHVYVTYLPKQKKMPRQLSLLMKLMLLVVSVVLD